MGKGEVLEEGKELGRLSRVVRSFRFPREVYTWLVVESASRGMTVQGFVLKLIDDARKG